MTRSGMGCSEPTAVDKTLWFLAQARIRRSPSVPCQFHITWHMVSCAADERPTPDAGSQADWEEASWRMSAGISSPVVIGSPRGPRVAGVGDPDVHALRRVQLTTKSWDERVRRGVDEHLPCPRVRVRRVAGAVGLLPGSQRPSHRA